MSKVLRVARAHSNRYKVGSDATPRSVHGTLAGTIHPVWVSAKGLSEPEMFSQILEANPRISARLLRTTSAQLLCPKLGLEVSQSAEVAATPTLLAQQSL